MSSGKYVCIVSLTRTSSPIYRKYTEMTKKQDIRSNDFGYPPLNSCSIIPYCRFQYLKNKWKTKTKGPTCKNQSLQITSLYPLCLMFNHYRPYRFRILWLIVHTFIVRVYSIACSNQIHVLCNLSKHWTPITYVKMD